MDLKSLRYSPTHEWASLEGEVVTVGISRFAVDQLTDLIVIVLPAVGTSVTEGKRFGEVESVKAVSDLYSPVSGEVVEVNPELESNPALVNTDPYNAGWLFKVKLSNPQEISSLKTAAEYRIQIGT